jgi:phosphoribosylformylglycinamidine cyclo-ligase
MVVIVSADKVEEISASLRAANETVETIGTIEKGERGCTVTGSAGTWSAREDWSASHDA